LICVVAVQPAKTGSTSIIVPDDYLTIQAAINAATYGDTIFVKTGTYYEKIVVDRSVSLVGENRDTTVIDGNWTGTIIHVISDNVNISGFTVRNCILSHARAAVIHLDSVSGCEIRGNTLSNGFITDGADSGIWIDSSSNNHICDNELSLFSYAIGAPWGEGNNMNISNNLISNSRFGIYLKSDDSVLRNNLILNCSSIGIYILHCGNATLKGNNMTANFHGFSVYGIPLSHFIHNIDISNTVDEDPIYYLINQKNRIIDPESLTDIGFLALVNSTNIVIKDLNLTGKSQGLVLAYTTNCTVKNVNASLNNDGIDLFSSTNNIISDNVLLNRDWGVNLLHGSDYNILRNNTIMNNTNQGIALLLSDNNIIERNTVSNNEQGILLLQSQNNVIYHNDFVDNVEQVSIGLVETVNSWDNGYFAGGNYWSDYQGVDLYKGPFQNETGSDGVGDTPYVIDEHNRDKYPLMSPYVPLFCDLNDDGLVDISDVLRTCMAFGSSLGSPRWDPEADVTHDNRVRVDDVLLVASNFGRRSR